MTGAGGVGGLLWVNNHQSTFEGKTLPTGVQYAAYDGNGNVAALVKAADGSVTARYDYGPFAEPIRASGPMDKANPLRFSTKYTDYQSGLVYYGYRYYAPITGRWLSRDPLVDIRPSTEVDSSFALDDEHLLNGFVRNDPIGAIDIVGLADRKVADTNAPSICCPTLPPVDLSTLKDLCVQALKAKEPPSRVDRIGGFICCFGGVPYPVLNPGYMNAGDQDEEDCIAAHEDAHVPDMVLCPKCPNPSAHSATIHPPLTTNDSECRALAAQIACWQRKLSGMPNRTPVDKARRENAKKTIKTLQDRMKQENCKGKK